MVGLVLGLVVAAGLVIAFRPASGGKDGETAGTGRATVGRPAPGFSAKALDGTTVRLADYRGRTVLLNFWASWCVPCREEFPVLAAVQARDRPSVQVLGVVFNDSDSSARKFWRDHDGAWPALSDPRGRIAASYGVGFKPGLPETIVIDGRGMVRGRHVGEAFARDLDALLAQARSATAR